MSKKNLILGYFFGQIIFFSQIEPSIIHGWKATDLPFMMVKRFFFFHPLKRQIFGDASGQTSALILTVCRKHLFYEHRSAVLIIIEIIEMLGLWNGME